MNICAESASLLLPRQSASHLKYGSFTIKGYGCIVKLLICFPNCHYARPLKPGT